MHTEESHRIIHNEAPSTRSSPARAAFAQRTLQLAVAVICVALLIATVAEAWVRHGIEQQVAAAQVRNAAVQRDVSTTRQSIIVAESPTTIEREARSWGYVHAGDHPVIVVTGGSPTTP